MAGTNGTGFFEKHVEKIVVAAALAVLVFALIYWGRSTRTVTLQRAPKLGMTGTEYPPEDVDRLLDEMAGKMEKVVAAADPSGVRVPDPIERDARLYEPRRQPPLLAWGSQRAPLDIEGMGPKPDQPGAGQYALADLMPLHAPEKPLTEVHRELIIKPQTQPAGAGVAGLGPAPAAGPGFTVEEVITCHGAAVFDVGKLFKKWEAALKSRQADGLPASFIVLRVEVQRQVRTAEGEWTSPEPVSPAGPPIDPPLPVLPPLKGKTASQIRLLMPLFRGTIQQLAEPATQELIVEPDFYQIYWPNRQFGTWQIHKPKTRVTDLLNQPVEPQAQPGLVAARPAPRPAPRPRTPRPRPRPRPSGGRRFRPPPGKANLLELNPDMSGMEDSEEGMSPRTPVRRPPPGRVQPVRPRRPTVRPRVRERFVPAPMPRVGTEPVPAPEPVIVPPLADQLAHGIIEIWFHDTRLTEGADYRYRVRLVLCNPLFGRNAFVKNKADALRVALVSAWSAWSESFTVKRPTEFFVVGNFEARGRVDVDVFTMKWGQRVLKRFALYRGEPIGRTEKLQLVRPGGTEPEDVEVSFVTGAVAVDFDFSKKEIIPASNITRTTTEMLMLDETGKLRTKTMAADQASKRYQKLLLEVRQGVGAGVPPMPG